MAGHAVLVSRMADADAYAAEILADVGDHAADAVVARCAAALLHLHLHRGEVEFVVKGGNILRRQFVEIERGAHAAAAFVHKGAGLEQQDALRSDAAFLDPALEFLRRRGEVVKVGADVGGHEADIVTVHRIFGSGITEAAHALHATAFPGSAGHAPTARGGAFRHATASSSPAAEASSP